MDVDEEDEDNYVMSSDDDVEDDEKESLGSSAGPAGMRSIFSGIGGGIFGRTVEVSDEEEPLPFTPFVGSDSSSSGDERERRLISGRGRSEAQEMALMEQRQARQAELDEEQAMREMDQADMAEELDGQQPVDPGELMRQWEKVQEDRRKPALLQQQQQTDEEDAAKKPELAVAKKPRKPRSKKGKASRSRSPKPKKRKEPAAEGEEEAKKKKKKAPPRKKKSKKQSDTADSGSTDVPVVPATEKDIEAATKVLASAAAAQFEMFARARSEMGTSKISHTAVNPKEILPKGAEKPHVLKYLGDFARACTVTFLWAGDTPAKPHPEDINMIKTVYDNSNLFMAAGLEMGKRTAENARILFEGHGNEALVNIVDALATTTELHLQPTVRKAPSEQTVDVWTGETLAKPQLRYMSSMVFNPNEEGRSPNSVICSKHPAIMFGLIHMMLHFDQYCKLVIREGLSEFQGQLDPTHRWDKTWSICVGPKMAKQHYMDWPKTGTSTTPFSDAVVKLREWIRVCLWLDSLLAVKAAAFADTDKGKGKEEDDE